MKKTFFALAVSIILSSGIVRAGLISGPSTTYEPFVVPHESFPDIDIYSIVSAGPNEPMFDGYFHTGSNDGTAAYSNNDGTFTILVNHEIPYIPTITVPFPLSLVIPSFVNEMRPLAHGGKGSHIAKWVVNNPNHPTDPLKVISGEDLITSVFVWDKGTSNYVASLEENFQVLCSADLAPQSAFYNSNTGNGTLTRLHLTGEEFSPFDVAAEIANSQGMTREQVVDLIPGSDYKLLEGGRAFATLVDGPNVGTTYELAALGNMNFENAVASPHEQEKTVVLLSDDDNPGQVYIYVGSKNSSGTLDIDKAGLTNGSIYGMQVNGQLNEGGINTGDTFTLHNFGDVRSLDWTDIENTSDDNTVTRFSKPEDLAWDTQNSNRFYFVSSGVSNPTRLWRVTLNDISQPETGGTIEILIDGSLTPEKNYRSFDNITCDFNGDVFVQEDGGILSRIWHYDTSEETMVEIAHHNPLYFQQNGQPEFISTLGETSGILDLSGVLGQGWYLLTSIVHVDAEEPLDKLPLFEFDPPYYVESQVLVMFIPHVVDIEPDTAIKLAFNSDFILSFETTPGFNYQVQRATDLSFWEDVGNVHIHDGSSPKQVQVSPTASGEDFYRVLRTTPSP